MQGMHPAKWGVVGETPAIPPPGSSLCNEFLSEGAAVLQSRLPPPALVQHGEGREAGQRREGVAEERRGEKGYFR